MELTGTPIVFARCHEALGNVHSLHETTPARSDAGCVFDLKRRTMKKRLRKKKHRGEFAEWGRQLIIRRDGEEGVDEFLDAFLDEAIEANDCYCGGSVLGDQLDFVVELGLRSEDPAAKFEKITAWLDARSDVKSWKAGEEFDIWHGGYCCIAEAGEA
jgi:uncharacterized protein YggL (DUF469 family)